MLPSRFMLTCQHFNLNKNIFRLADELRCEQDTAMILERERKLLEAQTKDAQTRVDEAETNALKGR